jgi:hypothetical protein
LAERLLAENDALKQAVAELKAEVATLKGVKGRPEVKPSGMEKASSDPGATNRGRGGRGKADRLTVDEERVVEADVPAGSRFKGYEDFLVQDLVRHRQVDAGEDKEAPSLIGATASCGSLDARDLSPDREGLRADGSVLAGGEVIAVEIKEVVDLVVGGEEPLRLAG